VFAPKLESAKQKTFDSRGLDDNQRQPLPQTKVFCALFFKKALLSSLYPSPTKT
jgi:hypothetical protein